MFSSVLEINRDINHWKNFSNIYHSIYTFRETEEKENRTGPNYETALINRVVLDLDSYKKTRRDGELYEWYTGKGLEDIRKVEDWAEKKQLLRHFRFTGGGFNIIFSAIGHPLKLRDFEINLHNEIGIDIDIATIGDTSRMMRVTNSFNFKDHRKCYCIPLSKEELYLPYEKIKKIAQKPRDERFIYGSETHDFSSCKIDKKKIKLKKLSVNLSKAKGLEADDILINYGWKVEHFCDTIKGIISLSHVGNALRYELLKYLKTIVKLSAEDAIRVLVALLGTEGVHSAIEGQAKYVYGYNKRFNPKWKLKQLGYCDPDCSFCNDYKNIVWNLIKNENCSRC